MIHSKSAWCEDCGSDDPAVTVGWPVCRNELFHLMIQAPRRSWLGRRLYRGSRRAGKFSRTVEDIKRDMNTVYFATGQGEITIPPWATALRVGDFGGSAANWHSGYGGTWGVTRITNNRSAA